jgi:hypothetical protein
MAKVYNLTSEPCGATYAALLRFAQSKGFRALLVTRLPEWIDSDCRGLIQRLEPHLISAHESKEWPGTILHGNATAIVRTYALNHGCAELLTNSAEGLWGWQHPSRPEDLCLLRESGSPFLTTIAHEADCYFELDDDEHAELTSNVVGIAALLAPGS